MSETPRTDAYRGDGPIDSEAEDAFDFARTLERELAEAQHRIRLLISERNSARGSLSIRQLLCDELKALLGTEDVAEGVASIKEMQARIAELERDAAIGRHALGQIEADSDKLTKLQARIAELESDLVTAEIEERAMKARIAALEKEGK